MSNLFEVRNNEATIIGNFKDQRKAEIFCENLLISAYVVRVGILDTVYVNCLCGLELM